MKNVLNFWPLELKTDMDQLQEFLESGEFLQYVQADQVYKERPKNDFCGTYEIKVNSRYEFERFMKKLNGFEGMEKVTFEHWFNNRYELGDGREIKFTKFLRRMAVNESIIDFYSTQSRYDEEVIYLTISADPMHILGMTSYNNGTWNSCQKFTDERSIHLAGSLHDTKLFVAMVHDNKEDVYNMAGKLRGRTVLRLINYKGIKHLFPSVYYGDAKGKSQLHAALKALEYKHIHSSDIRFRNNVLKDQQANKANKLQLIEEANGLPLVEYVHTVQIKKDIERHVTIECPNCSGLGLVTLTIKELDILTNSTCPLCEGSKEYKTLLCETIDKQIEIVSRLHVPPYTDCYSHNGTNVKMLVNKHKLNEHMKQYSKEYKEA